MSDFTVVLAPAAEQDVADAFLWYRQRNAHAADGFRTEVFDAMDRGRIDLLLHADDGNVPANFPRQAIFEEEFVCVVAKESPFVHKLTLNQYLDGLHVGVTIFGGSQTIPDQRLATSGLNRRCAFRVPYFAVAMRAVAGTNLIATVPKRIALCEAHNPDLKIVKAPKPMSKFTYLMVWHRRMDSDAAHIWLRNTVQEACKTISAPSIT